MVIPDKMRLNRFQAVRIPNNCDFFARFGTSMPLDSQFSGDDELKPVQSKLDAIISTENLLEQDMRDYDAQRAKDNK